MKDPIDNGMPASGGEPDPNRRCGWSYPDSDIRQIGDCCEIRFWISRLEKESIVVETGEDILVLSGLRWETRPGETISRLLPFRRLVELPGTVNEGSCQAAYNDGVLILTLFGVEQTESQRDSAATEGRNYHEEY